MLNLSKHCQGNTSTSIKFFHLYKNLTGILIDLRVHSFFSVNCLRLWLPLTPAKVSPFICLWQLGMREEDFVLQCCGAEKPPWQLSCSCCGWSGSLCLPHSLFFFAFPVLLMQAVGDLATVPLFTTVPLICVYILSSDPLRTTLRWLKKQTKK